ncbi:hypothetical protein FT663_00944 [Candidozyma haemuli var. vulneris]|uniref:Uncharacterized protein n=1 Tax=Candidozyma haemuli TaxID=45357 RepID=A0A2V1AT11_9ASCO|nr:hypothetical protein CXQ85_001860 [[Candida] haemuloni]KAF3993120.1 hypothetical protein FT662_00748 [[Candida] haemuloni var. vulneris]KAF3994970.1 hypothetical protein FT663_00944 [[Candida] haemuloni var. vulneris]PVH20081.1 hypothetical protein CXQ85_001860 [[Candida] haemuloni]
MVTRISARNHEESIRALYRGLIRGLYKTQKLPIIVDTSIETDPNLLRELQKVSVNPSLYGEFLASELKYYIKEKAASPTPSSVGLYTRLSKGESLCEIFQAIQQNPSQPQHWHSAIQQLIQFRDDSFRRQKWKAFYYKNRKQIDEERRKPQRNKRQGREPGMPTPENTRRAFKSLKSNERLKRYKKAMKESEEDANFVVRNYLKKLQLEGRIPNPYKLPYVSDTLTLQSVNLPDPKALIPGSTKTFVMEQAYDKEYIDAIIKPEVEYLINTSFMKDIDEQINVKGPQKSVINFTNAGVSAAYYLGPHSTKSKMKGIALTIKRSTRLSKVRHVWNMKSTDKVAIAHEKRVGNGYAVQGSKGYSGEEIMFTREYYEELMKAEADWEALMDDIRNHDNIGKMPPLHERKEQYRKVWRKSLDIASEYIDKTLKEMSSAHQLSDRIFRQQAALQKALDEKYEKRAKRYSQLLDVLKEQDVFMHSEIINFKDPVSRGFDVNLEEDSFKNEKNRGGVPEVERLNMGKKLGDYLAMFNFRFYQMGRRFRERFKF